MLNLAKLAGFKRPFYVNLCKIIVVKLKLGLDITVTISVLLFVKLTWRTTGKFS